MSEMKVFDHQLPKENTAKTSSSGACIHYNGVIMKSLY